MSACRNTPRPSDRVRATRVLASALVLGHLVSALEVGAEEPAVVTEAEYLAPLDADHPAVLAQAAVLARAAAERRQAGALHNPTLEFEYEAPDDEAEQSTFKLGWQPPLDGRRGLAVDASEAAVRAARHDLAWAELVARQELRAAYARWAVAEQRRERIAQHVATVADLEERLVARAARGEESQLAAGRFALAVTEWRVELARAEADLLAARADAFALRGDLQAPLRPVLPELPPVPDEAETMARPDLLARSEEVEAATLRRRLAGRVLEFPTLIVGWTRVSSFDAVSEGPYLGVAWEAPLFDRRQGAREESARAVEIARARQRRAEIAATQRNLAARETYATLVERLRTVDAVVDGAPAVAEAATASFLVGESNVTDLLETLRSVLSGRLAALHLRADALAAHRELELSVGRALTEGDR